MTMQQSRSSQIAEPTPIFGAYRRGYDPEQVDRYVADQQRRLDEAQLRASEAERKLAAAVGQLRELHRRVGVLEQNQQRPSHAIRLDGVGDHIQRIFEEAREGAEAMRHGAEAELAELRQKTITEARSIVAGARKKAEETELETARRRREELERLDEDRSHAASQLTYLHEQRKNAVSELLRIREVIDSTIAEVSADLRPRGSSPQAPAPTRRGPLRGWIPVPGDYQSALWRPMTIRTCSLRENLTESTRCSAQSRWTQVTNVESKRLDWCARASTEDFRLTPCQCAPKPSASRLSFPWRT